MYCSAAETPAVRLLNASANIHGGSSLPCGHRTHLVVAVTIVATLTNPWVHETRLGSMTLDRGRIPPALYGTHYRRLHFLPPATRNRERKMRWYTLSPALPAKAALRVRAAPSTSAPERAQVSRGKLIAAVGPVFEVDDGSGDGDTLLWLPVLYDDDESGDVLEGFMMAALPDDTPMIVPWEDTELHCCCKIVNPDAPVFSTPSPEASTIGSVAYAINADSAYGVIEMTGDFVQIQHEQYGLAWFKNSDIEVICERLHHHGCDVPHRFYTYHEDLPEKATIITRAFPSSSGNVEKMWQRTDIIEASLRCGDWLKLTGDYRGLWCMLRSGSTPLASAVVGHGSSSCSSSYPASVEEEEGSATQAMEVISEDHSSPEIAGNLAGSDEPDEKEVNNRQESTTEPSAADGSGSEAAVAERCQELATNEIDANQHEPQEQHDTELEVDQLAEVEPSPAEAIAAQGQESEADARSSAPSSLSWDETPTSVKPRQPSWSASESDARAHPEVPPPMPSWEDRPIHPAAQASYTWEDQPIRPRQDVVPSEDDPSTAAEMKDPSVVQQEPHTVAESHAVVPHHEEPEDVEMGDTTVKTEYIKLGDETVAGGQHEPKEWYWEEAPIKSRHAQRVAREAVSDQAVTDQPMETEDVTSRTEWQVLRRQQARPRIPHAVEEAITNRESDAAASEFDQVDYEDPLTSPVIGVVAPDANISWHSDNPDEAYIIDAATIDSTDRESRADTHPPPHHPPAAVVSSDGSTITWHSNDAAEDVDAFRDTSLVYDEDGRGIQDLESGPSPQQGMKDKESMWIDDQVTSSGGVEIQQAKEADVVGELVSSQEACTHVTGESAIGENGSADESLAQEDTSTNDALEQKDERKECADAAPASDDEKELSIADEDEAVVDDIDVSMPNDSDSADSVSPIEVVSIAEGREFDETFLAQPASAVDAASDSQESPESEDEEDFVIHSVNLDEEVMTRMPQPETQTPSHVAVTAVDDKLRSKLAKYSTDLPTYRVLKAIALSEGADAILEALASTDDCATDLLWHAPRDDSELLEGKQTVAAPLSPPSSSNKLLDMLYSRDVNDGYSTPKKTTPARNIPRTPESAKERLASILRRTPQKANESFSKIISNANPDDILMAEFGSSSDELGLFGSYQYPAASTTRFMGASTRTPTKATTGSFTGIASHGLQKSALFTSPLPKENPLKRSASAIAKTPPVALSRTLSGPSQPSSAVPTVTASVAAEAERVAPPVAVKARPVSSLAPPTTKPALPRPSLVAPSATSQLHRPATPSFPSPKPVAGSTARSFGTSEELKSKTIATLSVAPAAPVEQPRTLARTQSLLPRKTMIPTPSPSKIGLTRINSMAPPTPTKPSGIPQSRIPIVAATPDGTASDALASRRASFGFSRPSITKK